MVKKSSTYSILTKWKWIISLFLFFTPVCAQAQIVQSLRYEIELDQEEEGYKVAPDQNGLIVFKGSANNSSSLQLFSWKFIKLDEALKEQWTRVYLLDPTLVYQEHKIHKSHLFILFSSTKSYTYKVLLINTRTGTLGAYDIRSYLPIQVHTFQIADNGIMVGGSYNFRTVVLLYNFKLNRSIVLPNLYTQKGELSDISTNKDSFDVLVSSSVGKNKVIQLFTYDYVGKMLNKTMLFPKRKMSLQTGEMIRDNSGTNLVFGTYGHKRSSYSRGLYVADLNKKSPQIQYYNFADLENFFNYLKEKKMKRIKRKIIRRKAAGKKLKFNYRIKIHDVIQKNDEYILLGEAFYPRFKRYPAHVPSHIYLYSHSRSYSRVVFDSYHFTHAVIAGFNKNGSLIWDNSFEIDDVENKQLDQVVQVKFEGDQLYLCYSHDDQISTKVINQSQVLKDKNPTPVALKYDKDELRKSYKSNRSGVIRGKNNSFYAFGVQKIKNLKDEGVKLNREVFFINKVIYK